jgi:hypothetical protein
VPALRCIGLLDSASLSTPPHPSSRAFNSSSESYAMTLSAATDGEEATASPVRRRPYTGRNPYAMSNAVIQRVRVRNLNNLRRWVAHSAAIAC